MVSPAKCISGRSVADWIAAYPVVSDLCALTDYAMKLNYGAEQQLVTTEIVAL